MKADLIYDIGMWHGNDTAYYLERGFRVLAIDANPLLVAKARARSAQQISTGRLTILPAGIGKEKGTHSFWVNNGHTEWSSLTKKIACRDGNCREEKVECVTFQSILDAYGIPYYLKVDIEGNDVLCIETLVGGELPQYISAELMPRHPVLSALYAVGFRRFKIINQVSFTDSIGILRNEVLLRALRKACAKFSTARFVLNRLPEPMLPKRADFERWPQKLPYKFTPGQSGPFGEQTYGPWLDFERVQGVWSEINRTLKAKGGPAGTWFDVHATT